MLPRSLAVGILSLVTLVWGVDFGAQFVTDHQPSPAIQATFLALVGGALIRAGWVARKQADNESGSPATEELPPPEQRVSRPPAQAYLEAPPTIPPPPPRSRDERDGRHRRGLLRLRWAWT